MVNGIKSFRDIVENTTPQVSRYINNPELVFQSKKPNTILSNPDVKHAVIKLLLSEFKNDDLAGVKSAIDFLHKHNIHWPEITAIERSLAARKPELIKRLLYKIKNLKDYNGFDMYEVQLHLNYVGSIFPDAPELDIIKRALQTQAMKHE